MKIQLYCSGKNFGNEYAGGRKKGNRLSKKLRNWNRNAMNKAC